MLYRGTVSVSLLLGFLLALNSTARGQNVVSRKTPEMWSILANAAKSTGSENLVIPIRALDASAAILCAGASVDTRRHLEASFPGIHERRRVLASGEMNGWRLHDGEIVSLAKDGPASRSRFAIGDKITSAASSVSIDNPVPSRSFHGLTKEGIEFHRDMALVPEWALDQIWGESSVWINANARLRGPFVRSIQAEFGSGVFLGDFGNSESKGVRELRKWINHRGGTWQKEDQSGVVGGYIVAVSHVGERWATPFDAEKTQDEPFGVEEKLCKYMIHQRVSCKHRVSEIFETVVIPLEYGSIVFVIPKRESTLQHVVSWFADNGFESTIDSLLSVKPVLREVHLPKFEYSSKLKFGELLPEKFRRELIGPSARYDAIFEDKTGFINEIVLNADVACSESGFDSRGVAVSEILVLGEETVVKVNRPFLFFSVHEESKLVDVLGIVQRPKSNVR